MFASSMSQFSETALVAVIESILSYCLPFLPISMQLWCFFSCRWLFAVVVIFSSCRCMTQFRIERYDLDVYHYVMRYLIIFGVWKCLCISLIYVMIYDERASNKYRPVTGFHSNSTVYVSCWSRSILMFIAISEAH